MDETLLLLGWLAVAFLPASLLYVLLVGREYDRLTAGFLAALLFGLVAILPCVALFVLVQFTDFGY